MHHHPSSSEKLVLTQSLPSEETQRQLPLHSMNVLLKPSVNTLRDAMERASWRSVLIQCLSLVIITVTLGSFDYLIPSSALHAAIALNFVPAKLLAWLHSPLNGITLVLASFFIELGPAYIVSKCCGGQGTFLAHCYCFLLYTVPLITISGIVLLLPATGWLVLLLTGIVFTLFIYSTVLHTFTIMAVHHLGAGKAASSVFMLPILLLVIALMIGLIIWTEGEVLIAWLDFSPWNKKQRKSPDEGIS
jgi:hypothetical protein